MDQQYLNDSNLKLFSKRNRQEYDPYSYLEAAPQQRLSRHEGFICDDCRAVDWSWHLRFASSSSRDSKDLRTVSATVEELRNSWCRICAILSTIMDPMRDGRQQVLRALPLSRIEGIDANRLPEDSASRRMVLSFSSHGMRQAVRTLAFTRNNKSGVGTMAPTLVDYSNFKKLLTICETEHKASCAIEPRPNVLGLEVIDIKTQEVIKAPDGCRYLALSYVWGKDSGSSSAHNIGNSPPVIRDAISVTNSMGYSYLWVDRYCISESTERHRMISQMDQIYANASFTIIAAADGDTELGLCGVSMPRQPQRVNIQDVTLLELPDAVADLASSKWTTRGWTYQEGYLSRRRLIFTKTQVLFLCNRMYATESLQEFSRCPCVFDDIARFHHLIPKFYDSQPRLSTVDLLHQIQEYSTRKLTRPSDSLSAILGVLSYYVRTSANLEWPVLQLPWGLIAKKYAEKNVFGLHFFWYHEDQLPTRRTDFPSWSWTGWGGPIKFLGQTILLHPERTVKEDRFSYLDWQLFMQDTEGKTSEMYDIAWKEFEIRNSVDRLRQADSKPLLVSCLVIPVSYRESNQTACQRKHKTEVCIEDTHKHIPVRRTWFDDALAILQIWKGIYVGLDKSHIKLDQQIKSHDDILGLIFAGRNRRCRENDYHCLLVRHNDERDKDLYERVGLLLMNDDTDLEFSTWSSGYVNVDAAGNVLDRFTLSDSQRRHPFADTAERRTICLV